MQHNLARVRLAATDAAAPVTEVPENIRAILALPTTPTVWTAATPEGAYTRATASIVPSMVVVRCVSGSFQSCAMCL